MHAWCLTVNLALSSIESPDLQWISPKAPRNHREEVTGPLNRQISTDSDHQGPFLPTANGQCLNETGAKVMYMSKSSVANLI
jgi:hypothetical protein